MDIKKIEEEKEKIGIACEEMLRRKIFCKKQFIEAKLKLMELEEEYRGFERLIEKEKESKKKEKK